MERIKNIKLFLFDMDGTVWVHEGFAGDDP